VRCHLDLRGRRGGLWTTEARERTGPEWHLLDLSKADEGRLVPVRHPIDLAGLAAEIGGGMSARARTAEVQIVADVAPQTIHGDPELIRRVLENLVDNAIRHAPAETSVRITSTGQGASVEIRVADAGPGVPPDLRERVFDRFVQGDTPSRAGRGLTFCKLAVEAHGGTIWSRVLRSPRCRRVSNAPIGRPVFAADGRRC
jgi:signal transduction histidine kinase